MHWREKVELGVKEGRSDTDEPNFSLKEILSVYNEDRKPGKVWNLIEILVKIGLFIFKVLRNHQAETDNADHRLSEGSGIGKVIVIDKSFPKP